MRAVVTLTIAVFVAIGIGVGVIAAIGSSNESNALSLANRSVQSVAASPFAQADLTIDGSSPTLASVRGLHVIVVASTDDASTPLARSSLSRVGLSVELTDGRADLMSLRLTDARSLYVRIDLAALAGSRGLSAAQRSEVELIAPIVDGRWFMLPKSVVDQIRTLISSRLGSSEQQAKSQIARQRSQLAKTLLRDIDLQALVPAGGTQVTTATVYLDRLLSDLYVADPPLRKSPGIQGALGSTEHGSTAVVRLSSHPGDEVMQQAKITYDVERTRFAIAATITHVRQSVRAPLDAVALSMATIRRIFGSLLPSGLS